MPSRAVIDANALYSRAFFAANSAVGLHDLSSYTSPDGLPTGSAIAAFKIIFHLIETYGITHALFCWDGKQKRDKGRHDKPATYHEEKDNLRRLIETLLSLPCPVAEYEADDAVATAAYREESNGKVMVVSSDKDLQQLQGGGIEYYCLNKKKILSRDDILSKWGILRPIHLPLYLALSGDACDNIKGLPGYGPKKTSRLMECITDGMKFRQAYEAVKNNLPESLHESFDASLELTLLRSDIEGIPELGRIKFTDPENLRAEGLEPLIPSYYRLISNQSGQSIEESMGLE